MHLSLHAKFSSALLAAALIIASTPAVAQTPAAHLETTLPWSNGAVTNAAIDARIQNAETQARAYAPIPRFALYDMAYPKDSTEAAAMHGYAILVVTALVQDSTEFPLARVYVRDATGDHALTLAASIASFVPASQSAVRSTFGRFRWDAIYVIPLASRANVGDLLADFATLRQGFRLTHYAGDVPAQLARLKLSGAAGATPPDAVVWTMIRREYPDLATQLGPKK